MISTHTFQLSGRQNFTIPIKAEYIILGPNTTFSFQKCTIKRTEGDVTFFNQTITNPSEEIMQLSIIDGALQLTPLEAAPSLETVGDDTDFTADTM